MCLQVEHARVEHFELFFFLMCLPVRVVPLGVFLSGAYLSRALSIQFWCILSRACPTIASLSDLLKSSKRITLEQGGNAAG